jgi:hypothetical protein
MGCGYKIAGICKGGLVDMSDRDLLVFSRAELLTTHTPRLEGQHRNCLAAFAQGRGMSSFGGHVSKKGWWWFKVKKGLSSWLLPGSRLKTWG